MKKKQTKDISTEAAAVEATELPDGMAKEVSNLTLKELVEQNIKWSQVIYTQNKKIKKRLTLMVWVGTIRLFIILTPLVLAIVLAIMYMPLLQDLIADYQKFFGDDLGIKSLGNFFGQFQAQESGHIKLSPEQIELLRNINVR